MSKPQPVNVSVSSLELFRVWRDSEDLGLEWLLPKLLGEEPQTPAMMAGEAFHAAVENSAEGEANSITANGYTFYFRTDAVIEIPPIREVPIEKRYGELLVRGRLDGVNGRGVTDYKTTGYFEADRLMEGYHWRFYLSMAEADYFDWKVFVLAELLGPCQYEVIQTHDLRQYRYDGLEDDCARLASDYLHFAYRMAEQGIAIRKAYTRPAELVDQLKASLEGRVRG